MFIDSKIFRSTLREVEKVTGYKYEIKNDLIANDIIEDLLDEIIGLKAKLEDLKNDIDENYERKRVDLYLMYGISERDFN